MKYLYETHLHTSEVSPCGNVPAQVAVRMYKLAGYSGVMVTDHLATDYFVKNYSGSNWHEKVEYFLGGYKAAKALEDDSFAVLLGFEVRFDENSNDYLVFGADENFLFENEWFTKMGIKEFKVLAGEYSLTVVQAHPFRQGITITNPRYIDGVEVFNGNRRHDSSNSIAEAWADRFGLLKTSGSDFHEKEDLARGGIYLENFVTDSKALRKEILSGRYTLKTPRM